MQAPIYMLDITLGLSHQFKPCFIQQQQQELKLLLLRRPTKSDRAFNFIELIYK